MVECTIDLPDKGDQVANAIRRAEQARRSLDNSGWPEIQVLPVVATILGEREIAGQKDDAEGKGVLVLCSNDLRKAVQDPSMTELLHGQALPAYGSLDAQLAGMDALIADHPVAAWKIYTHAPGRGWYLDDHEGGAPQVGNAFLDKVRAIGPRIVSVHKGFGNGSRFASPVDIGPAAKQFPDISFVIYHSGYEIANHEGPYDPNGSCFSRRRRCTCGVSRRSAAVSRCGKRAGSYKSMAPWTAS